MSIEQLAKRARNFPAAKLVCGGTSTGRTIGMRPELASGYAGQISINTAARYAGRIELKNKIISLSERGYVLCHLLK